MRERERERERCHNATLQLLTDSHTDQISRTLTCQQTAALPSALARTIWRIGYKKFLEIFVKIDWRKKSSEPVMIPDLSDDTELLKHNTCFFLFFKLSKQSGFEV